jgi:HrpA-like RNA helicase
MSFEKPNKPQLKPKVEKPKSPIYLQKPYNSEKKVIVVGEEIRNLPLIRVAQEIINSVNENHVTLVDAFTGSGKSAIPNMLFSAGLIEKNKKLLVLQPTRSLTKNYQEAAHRTAIQSVVPSSDVPTLPKEIEEENGEFIVRDGKLTYSVEIGDIDNHYQTNQPYSKREIAKNQKLGVNYRGYKEVDPDNMGRVVTDGMALNYINNDPLLSNYSLIIFDEFDRAGVNMELFIDYCEFLIRTGLRPDLKLVISSATLDINKLQQLGGDLNTQKITLEEERPIQPKQVFLDQPVQYRKNKEYVQAILSRLESNIHKVKKGDAAAIFVSSKSQIEELCKQLAYSRYDIRPYHAGMEKEDLEYARSQLNPNQQIVYVATDALASGINPAPQITLEILSGTVNRVQYNPLSGFETISLENAPKSLLEQEKGRMGRNPDNRQNISYEAHYLMSKSQYDALPDFPSSDVERLSKVNLEKLILLIIRQLIHTRMYLENGDEYTWEQIESLCDVRNSKILQLVERDRVEKAINNLKRKSYISKSELITEKGEFFAQMPTNLDSTELLLSAHENNLLAEFSLLIPTFENSQPFYRRITSIDSREEQVQDALKEYGVEYALQKNSLILLENKLSTIQDTKQLENKLAKLKDSIKDLNNQSEQAKSMHNSALVKKLNYELKDKTREYDEYKKIIENSEYLGKIISELKADIEQITSKLSDFARFPQSDIILKYDILKNFKSLRYPHEKDTFCKTLSLRIDTLEEVIGNYDALIRVFSQVSKFQFVAEKHLPDFTHLSQNPAVTKTLLAHYHNRIVNLRSNKYVTNNLGIDGIESATVKVINTIALSTNIVSFKSRGREYTFASDVHPIDIHDIIYSELPFFETKEFTIPFGINSDHQLVYRVDVNYKNPELTFSSTVDSDVKLHCEDADLVRGWKYIFAEIHEGYLENFGPKMQKILMEIINIKKLYKDYAQRSYAALDLKVIPQESMDNLLEPLVSVMLASTDKIRHTDDFENLDFSDVNLSLDTLIPLQLQEKIDADSPKSINVAGIDLMLEYPPNNKKNINVTINPEQIGSILEPVTIPNDPYNREIVYRYAMRQNYWNFGSFAVMKQDYLKHFVEKEFTALEHKPKVNFPEGFDLTRDALPDLPDPIPFTKNPYDGSDIYMYPVYYVRDNDCHFYYVNTKQSADIKNEIEHKADQKRKNDYEVLQRQEKEVSDLALLISGNFEQLWQKAQNTVDFSKSYSLSEIKREVEYNKPFETYSEEFLENQEPKWVSLILRKYQRFALTLEEEMTKQEEKTEMYEKVEKLIEKYSNEFGEYIDPNFVNFDKHYGADSDTLLAQLNLEDDYDNEYLAAQWKIVASGNNRGKIKVTTYENSHQSNRWDGENFSDSKIERFDVKLTLEAIGEKEKTERKDQYDELFEKAKNRVRNGDYGQGRFVETTKNGKSAWVFSYQKNGIKTDYILYPDTADETPANKKLEYFFSIIEGTTKVLRPNEHIECEVQLEYPLPTDDPYYVEPKSGQNTQQAEEPQAQLDADQLAQLMGKFGGGKNKKKR